MTTSWHARLLLVRPARVVAALRLLADGAVVPEVPNLWQIELGVLRMLHRVLFRSHTIGLSRSQPVRPTRRAQWLQFRALRIPLLLAHGALRPWDLSGLASTPAQLRRHLLGTHHDALQFVYDLQILACHPGALATLRAEAAAVVQQRSAHGERLRDLCVFDRYHETLLAELDRVLANGFVLPEAVTADPDVSLYAWLQWCARQPSTPSASWIAWREGRLAFGAGDLPC